jgi:ribosomal protein S18 acetylase RimI-like enzyme
VSGNLRVRPASAGDADAIARVFTASFGTLSFLPKLHSPEEDRAFIADVVLREQDVLVAEQNGEVVGFISMAHGDTVEHLYVDPDRRGRGVGSTLLDEAKRLMPGGFGLWLFQRNEPARRFYEKHGMRLVQMTDGHANEEKTPDARYDWPGAPDR